MLLKRGSNDDNVKKLQEKLGIEVIGNFGPKTEIAVKEWQAKNGLTADGIVGPATWNKIMGVTPVVATPSIVTVPAAVSVPPSSFKLDKLKGHIPDAVLVQIPDTAAKFNITNTLRLAHFLAQCGHESGGFRATQENLNYSAKGLKGIFPKYFPGNTADAYARNPQKIANKVYSSRMSNGNEASGDGWKFRGRGYIQLTGRGNYTLFDKQVSEDILANPDLVATKYPLSSAAFFFNSNKLWTICDKGADDATVTAVTKRVNGGTIGLADRIKHFREYYNLLK
jgi:putative chitinase